MINHNNYDDFFDYLKLFLQQNNFVITKRQKSNCNQFCLPKDKTLHASMLEEICNELNKLYFDDSFCLSAIKDIFDKYAQK